MATMMFSMPTTLYNVVVIVKVMALVRRCSPLNAVFHSGYLTETMLIKKFIWGSWLDVIIATKSKMYKKGLSFVLDEL